MRILLLKAGFLNKIRPNVSVVYELAVQTGNREGLLLAGFHRCRYQQREGFSRTTNGWLLAGNVRFALANISDHCTRKNDPSRSFDHRSLSVPKAPKNFTLDADY